MEQTNNEGTSELLDQDELQLGDNQTNTLFVMVARLSCFKLKQLIVMMSVCLSNLKSNYFHHPTPALFIFYLTSISPKDQLLTFNFSLLPRSHHAHSSTVSVTYNPILNQFSTNQPKSSSFERSEL